MVAPISSAAYLHDFALIASALRLVPEQRYPDKSNQTKMEIPFSVMV